MISGLGLRSQNTQEGPILKHVYIKGFARWRPGQIARGMCGEGGMNECMDTLCGLVLERAVRGWLKWVEGCGNG